MSEQQRDDSLHLFIVLSRACEWVTAHAHRDIRRHGLNPTEYGVLELLYHKGSQPLQQIGEKVLMTSGNITYVVDKLVGKGLVIRKPCPEDRRVSFAEITDSGVALLDSVFPGHREVIDQAVSGLSDDEKRQAIDLLKKLGLYAKATFKESGS
ncbi:MarR family transcriptional regulator, 2-MHQ and catechol-resistance regulon repressor [Paenibacillus sp. UNCCL117]|uniref:MarR family winged helix-turn-helix transcriptional regulator n=1 Tax=unclassified Paenibacillus TaxID=185978 RepID=UPI000883004D|nr:MULTISPECIES: MarR family transcriptional regulator [unclassified Paenibacillus]SDD31619.1 MarR family transcriptional regulator, 2-MHQ and catechol-resistance regulon repressor [Paenibacillus sp. cl123]SFW40067.1 MarR family transcriptional regulator, 2-MHQ and catechol-resistance regulon repressor [Paenibacillus sp. UNCCL117]